MAAVAAGVIADGEELPDSEKKVSGILDVIEDRGEFLCFCSGFLKFLAFRTWHVPS